MSQYSTDSGTGFRLTVGTKLVVGFGAVVLAVVATGITSVLLMQSVVGSADRLFTQDLAAEELVSRVQVNMLRLREQTFQYLAAPEQQEPPLRQVRTLETAIAVDLQSLQVRESTTPKQQVLLIRAEVTLEAWYAARESGPFTLAAAGQRLSAIDSAVDGASAAAFASAESALGKFHQSARDQAAQGHDSAAQTVSKSTIITIALMALVAGIGGATALIITRSVARPIRMIDKAAARLRNDALPSLARVIRAVASGDLSKRPDVQIERLDVRTNDEIGDLARSFNSIADQVEAMAADTDGMVTNLRQLVGQLRASTTGVAGAGAQLAEAANRVGEATAGIAAATEQMAQGADEQLRSVDHATAGVHQLSGAIDQIAQASNDQASHVTTSSSMVTEVSSAINEVAINAQAVNQAADEATEAAQQGVRAVDKTAAGMSRIKNAAEHVTSTIAGLGKKSEKIGSIVSVIDDIAAQTNLLALNAAIEAAHAGDQGRGFAVVAEEVRNLAVRVTHATQEISDLVEGIQTSVADSIRVTEDGDREVIEGARLADESGRALRSILESVRSVSEQIGRISAAAQQMAAHSDEMVTATDGVSAAIQENSAAAQQMAADSSEVVKAVESVSSVTHQNSAIAQEVSASVSDISGQIDQVIASSHALDVISEELERVVGRFELGDGSARAE